MVLDICFMFIYILAARITRITHSILLMPVFICLGTKSSTYPLSLSIFFFSLVY